GQHAISVTYDQNILIFDNGQNSWFHVPKGEERGYSSPRKYKLDLNTKTATEVWDFEFGQSLWCPVCGSIYEDAPRNYFVDYTFLLGGQTEPLVQLIGLDAADQAIFRYKYSSLPFCQVAFNAIPIHLENTKFPTVGPQALNLSTRGLVGTGD